jgi:transcriptional regulator with XRE-family HTH domain
MNAKEALRLSGKNHHTIRTAKGYTVQALAVLSGVDEAIITAIEGGNFDFPISTIYELAAALNVDFRQILVDPTAYQGN